jgi:uncharacterized membrane protein
LFALFVSLAVVLWFDMPERYPVHFDLSGKADAWGEGPGLWILLVVICSFSFGMMHLIQRFLITDPDSSLLNVPYKELFSRLATERKIPVVLRTNRMLGLINTGTLLTFHSVLLLVYFTAQSQGSAARLASLSLRMVLVFVVLFPLVELVGVRRMIRSALVREGLMRQPRS